MQLSNLSFFLLLFIDIAEMNMLLRPVASSCRFKSAQLTIQSLL